MTVAAQNSFVSFAGPHVAAIALTVIVAAGLTIWARRARSEKIPRVIGLAVAGILLGAELLFYGCTIMSKSWGEFVKDALPLHLCGAAIYLTAWTMWRRNQHAYELLYFWGIAGTLQAIITPNLLSDFPSYWFVSYFIRHGGVVVAAVVATWGMGMRPARGAVLRVIIITNIFAAVVAGFDVLLGANYMFLIRPPVGESPFFFLPWPWYILVLECVAIALMLLLSLPFVRTGRSATSGGPGRSGACRQ